MFKRKYSKTLLAAGLGACLSLSLAAQNNSGSKMPSSVRDTTRPSVILTGVITDAVTKKGAAGVRIQVEDFSAAITDSLGHFSLKVPSYTAGISIEGEGYERRDLALKGRTTINVALLDDGHESFHEQVTLPLGRQYKTGVTAAVGQYNVNAGWSLPFESLDGALQGRVAGLNSIRRSGLQGAGANLFLRGFNSLYATNRPLIVIDNMLYDANDYGESIIANNYTNPFALIDVKDIDNITVLKDASSIYGTKGANGAIIVTTARAQSQATRIDFGIFSGFNQVPQNLPVMGAADYRTYLSEILQSKGLTPAQIAAQPYMNDDPSNPEYNRYHYNTDWQKKVLNNSRNQNYFLKITGGDNIATYGLSVGLTNNEGIIKMTDLVRYNTRFNAEFNFSKRFTGNTNLSFGYNEQNLKDQGISDKTAPLYLALIKAPFLNDKEVNQSGVESPNFADTDILGVTNPSVVIEDLQAINKYYRFFGSFGFNYDVSKYLRASTIFGVVYDKVRENIFVPRKGVANDTLNNAIADSRMASQVKRLFTIYNDTKLEYVRKFNNAQSFSARVGLRYQKNQSEQDFASSANSATDDLVSVQNGLASLRQVGGAVGDWNWVNIYLNAEYGYKNRYFVSLNAAMDGSSRFGKKAVNGISLNGNKFPVMPSLGLAWLVSSENFMAGSAINILKLRTSYSITGNDDIGNYGGLRTYVSQNLLGAQGLVRRGIANPALQWETVKKLNIGFDLAFFNERVGITLDAYKNTTTNMLVYEPLTTVTGFNDILTNSGKMQNTGLDLSLNVRVINTTSLKWDAGFTAATYKNKVLAVPDGSVVTSYANGTLFTAEGQPAAQFFGYTTNGVFVSDAEAAAAGLMKKNSDGSFSQFKGGDMRFTDRDGNKLIDDADRTVIGNANPDFFGGFNNRVLWKSFELNALFTFSKGNDVYNYLRYRLESASGIENQLMSVNNRWRGDGHLTNMPKATWADPMGNNRFSDRWIEDGSYFRLRSVSLQYNFRMKSSSFLKSTSVYAIASNVFTLTTYKGYDPEFSATPGLFTQGIDTGLDPQFRNITVGVRLGL